MTAVGVGASGSAPLVGDADGSVSVSAWAEGWAVGSEEGSAVGSAEGSKVAASVGCSVGSAGTSTGGTGATSALGTDVTSAFGTGATTALGRVVGCPVDTGCVGGAFLVGGRTGA